MLLLLFTIVSYLLLSRCSADEQSNLIFGRASMTANDHDAALVGMDSQKYDEGEEFVIPYLGSAAAERRRHVSFRDCFIFSPISFSNHLHAHDNVSCLVQMVLCDFFLSLHSLQG